MYGIKMLNFCDFKDFLNSLWYNYQYITIGGDNMITDGFDPKGTAVITPASIFGEQKHFAEIAIGTFSSEIYRTVLHRYQHEQIGEITAANETKPLHLLTVGDMKVVFYLSSIGSALASTDVIEINWKTGADKFILFGSAGGLAPEITTGKYVIPTEAYRDEGMSYHYAPPADYITIRNADRIAQLFGNAHIPFVKGRVWTTDALYMETREKVAQRKSEGCIAVEMELAGVQAVCDYYGFELYDLLVTGDVVDQEVYTQDGLYAANHSLDKFDIAVMIAKSLI